jgi:catechol 2,3-dioxygenase-like lactoylglutathione lyase family enzyme
MVNINNIQHIGIPVTHLQNSILFYQKLGFKNSMYATFNYKLDKGSAAMMQLGTITIELYQLPANEIYAIQNRQHGHIDHIAFDVDDIDEAFNTLKSNNFNVVENEPMYLNFWQNGCKYFNIIGPDGERLEFNQIL